MKKRSFKFYIYFQIDQRFYLKENSLGWNVSLLHNKSGFLSTAIITTLNCHKILNLEVGVKSNLLFHFKHLFFI